MVLKIILRNNKDIFIFTRYYIKFYEYVFYYFRNRIFWLKNVFYSNIFYVCLEIWIEF